MASKIHETASECVRVRVSLALVSGEDAEDHVHTKNTNKTTLWVIHLEVFSILRVAGISQNYAYPKNSQARLHSVELFTSAPLMHCLPGLSTRNSGSGVLVFERACVVTTGASVMLVKSSFAGTVVTGVSKRD